MQVRKFMNDKYMNKSDLKKTTQTANHQLDSHGDKEAEERRLREQMKKMM